jgi:hypothetical protein
MVEESHDTPFGTLVREDYYGYPKTESNLYMLDSNGRPVWFAERLLPDDVYANPIANLGASSFNCASWQGVTCEIDLRTGRIVNTLFTK